MSDSNVIFKYLFDDNYQPEYTNGVYGGVNPSGEMIMNFYFERFPIPYETEVPIDEDGNLGDDIVSIPGEFKYLRNVHSGIVMNKETAMSVYQWMHETLIEMGVTEDELSGYDE